MAVCALTFLRSFLFICFYSFIRTLYGFPSDLTTGTGVVNQDPEENPTCAPGCHLSCRTAVRTSPPSRFCYCRCRPATQDYGTLVYTAVVEDIWQVRCGVLGHPFIGTALAMNDTGLLDEFYVTRCDSDYTGECRSGHASEICTHWWASSLCMDTCAGFVNTASTTSGDPSTVASSTGNPLGGHCPPDRFFQTQKPSFGNPYTGCADLQQQCAKLYDRGYCQLKPTAMNCQETCGRCIGDDAYMPWNPVRSQLIQWAMNRRDDGTAKALISYFMRQYADYMSEVHRACRQEAASIENEHREHTQHRHRHHYHGERIMS